MKSITISPPNSLIAVSDYRYGVVPEFVPDKIVRSTPSLIMVTCYPYQDGETNISLGEAMDRVSDHLLVFNDVLETPGRWIVISTIDDDSILEIPVPEKQTRVRIWVDHPVWPSLVEIRAG